MPLPAAAAVVSGVVTVGGILANAAKTAIQTASKNLDGPTASSLNPLVDTMAEGMPFAGFRHELAKNTGMRVKIRVKTEDADTLLGRIGDITGDFERNDMRSALTRDLIDRKLAGLN